ncbi:MAG: DUF1326 domain-containing protein [Dehalococcoidia bacterium]
MAESWVLKGELAGTCPCDTPCPCIFGLDPNTDNGKCTAVQCMVIDSGNYGSTDLSGLKVALAWSWTGNVFNGNIAFGVYIDDGATEEQAGALEQILTGKAGGIFGTLAGLFGTVHGVKRAAIEYVGNGGKPSFRIGSFGNADLTLLTGADQQGPLVVANSPFDFGGKGLKIGTSAGRFVDEQWGYDTELKYFDHCVVDLAS